MTRIVLTGGPGAGKSTIAARIAADNPNHYILVPEAATQVYNHLRTRWDYLDLPARRDAQRRIYHLQIEQELRLSQLHPNKILLLDRGTIDGAAYWPDGPMDYWRDLNTTHETELSRYDQVIWLQTGAVLGLYDGQGSNACRFEDAQAAVESGKLLLTLWGGHPHLEQVEAFGDLNEKIERVKKLIVE